MKLLVWFFVLCAINWLVVCWVSWTWILGFSPAPLKMVAMALFAGFIQTVNVVIHDAIRRATEPSKEGK